MVSSGLDLKPGDEVIVFHDNHPSNLTAWNEKAKRFGFTVVEIPQVNPHPGMEYYVNAYKKAITAKTKILTFTHLTSTVGDLFPAKELCALAREHGVMSLVDGAQSFGLFDVNLADISPGLLQRQLAQVGVRRARIRRALRQRPRAEEHLAVDLQRLSWRGRHLEDDRELRPAR